jgi:hypothetical protein
MTQIHSTINRPNDFQTGPKIKTLDCSHPSLGITPHSRWMVTMQIIYDNKAANNTNYVQLTAYTLNDSPFFYHQWSHTHHVNFGTPYGYVSTDTFPIYFGDNTNLIIEAYTHYDPPAGQSYKIFLMSLLFTRIA